MWAQNVVRLGRALHKRRDEKSGGTAHALICGVMSIDKAVLRHSHHDKPEFLNSKRARLLNA